MIFEKICKNFEDMRQLLNICESGDTIKVTIDFHKYILLDAAHRAGKNIDVIVIKN